MTTRRLYERDLPDVLDDLAVGPYPDYLDNVLAVTAHRRQRPRWMALERWLPMDLALRRESAPRVPWRALAVVALLLILLAVAMATVGQRHRLPAPFGPAANGPIPFASGGDIYLGDPVTGQSRVLLAGPAWDAEPMFSRDGSLIAFIRAPSADDLPRIAVMNADGSGIRLLGDPLTLKAWTWTPDDRLVVVAEARSGLFIFDPAHPDAPPLHLAEDLAVDSPTTRPGTGDILIYGKSSDGDIGLYVMHADGSDRHPIVGPRPTGAERWDLILAKYSPDGSRIAIPHWDDAKGHLAIWITDPEGVVQEDLFGPPGFWYWGDPAWSNDGTRLAIGRELDTQDGSDPVRPTAIVDPDTGVVLHETGPSLGTFGAPLEWAPDDTSVLLLHLDPNGVGSQLLDPDGGPARRLSWTTDTTPDFQRLAP
jgi:hypothetical protein